MILALLMRNVLKFVYIVLKPLCSAIRLELFKMTVGNTKP